MTGGEKRRLMGHVEGQHCRAGLRPKVILYNFHYLAEFR